MIDNIILFSLSYIKSDSVFVFITVYLETCKVLRKGELVILLNLIDFEFLFIKNLYIM